VRTATNEFYDTHIRFLRTICYCVIAFYYYCAQVLGTSRQAGTLRVTQNDDNNNNNDNDNIIFDALRTRDACSCGDLFRILTDAFLLLHALHEHTRAKLMLLSAAPRAYVLGNRDTNTDEFHRSVHTIHIVVRREFTLRYRILTHERPIHIRRRDLYLTSRIYYTATITAPLYMWCIMYNIIILFYVRYVRTTYLYII